MRMSVVLLLFAASLHGQVQRPQQLEPVRARCRALVDSGKTRSLAVAVVKNGRIVWEEAFGYQDAERRVPATVETMYTLASTGKSITGTAILALARDGRIDLHAPAARYLAHGELSFHDVDPQTVTVETLLRMGVDIPHLWWHHWTDSAESPLSDAEVLRRYAFAVGPVDGGFYYSNLTFGVLAQIAADVTKRTIDDAVGSSVFRPFDLRHASVTPAPRFTKWLARSYGSDGALRPYSYSDPIGGAGYRMSIHDLIRYAAAHLGHAQGSAAAFSRELAAMHRTSRGYYAGWGHLEDAGGVRFAIANGAIVGAATEIKILPDDDLAVACLSNTTGFDVSSVVDDVIASFEPRYQKRFVIPPDPRSGAFSVLPAMVGAWEGTLESAGTKIPAVLKFEKDGTATASLGGNAFVPITNVRLDSGRVRGECACSVKLPDTHDAPTKLDLQLRFAGDRWFGSARVISTAARSDFSLPLYVWLRRATADSATVESHNASR